MHFAAGWKRRSDAFVAEATAILGTHEESGPARVAILRSSYDAVTGLNEWQRQAFKEALDCAAAGYFKAAHILGWVAFIDFLEMKMSDDGLVSIKKTYPKWDTSSLEALRESVNEHQMIEAARTVGLLSKTQMKAAHGLLNKRNECAHPNNYEPGLNETLGYLSEIASRVTLLSKKSLDN